jgi:ubiquinone/menaquinone biosynthesis C-methylase UbiE
MLERMKGNSAVRNSYDRWSRNYDDQENPTRDLDLLVLQSLVPPLKGRQVVEFGCGTGKNLRWLAPRCHLLLGLDFSAGMLAMARRKIRSPNVHLLLCDLSDELPLTDHFADVVLISLILEHMVSTEPVFRSAAQLMTAGAWLIVSEYHPDRINAGSGAQFQTRKGDPPHFIGSFAHSPAEMQRVAAAHGLRLVDTAEWFVESPPGTIQDDERVPRILSLRFRLDNG